MSKTWTAETIKFLTATQTRQLFRQIEDKRDKALFLVAYRHDLRPSEVGNLHVDNIDLDQQRIKITRLKKSLAGGHVMKPDEMKAIKSYLRNRKHDSPTLFTSKQRNPISRRMLDVLMKKYGAAARKREPSDPVPSERVDQIAPLLLFQTLQRYGPSSGGADQPL